jgi:hypothetical protein
MHVMAPVRPGGTRLVRLRAVRGGEGGPRPFVCRAFACGRLEPLLALLHGAARDWEAEIKELCRASSTTLSADASLRCELAFQLLVERTDGPYLLHSHHGGSTIKSVGVGEGRAIAEPWSSRASGLAAPRWVAAGRKQHRDVVAP